MPICEGLCSLSSIILFQPALTKLHRLRKSGRQALLHRILRYVVCTVTLKSVRPDRFWLPKLVPLAKACPHGGPILAKIYLPKLVPPQRGTIICVRGWVHRYSYYNGRTDDDLNRGKSHGLHMGAFYVSDTISDPWEGFK